MSAPLNEPSLIDQLDIRQNEVLDQLDELNARVEALLNECMASREVAAE